MDGIGLLRSRIAAATLLSGLALLSVLASGCGGADAPPPTTPVAARSEQPPASSLAAPPAATSAPALLQGEGAWPFVASFSAEDRAAELERLERDPGPIKSNWVPPGKSDRYGHAEGLISAPADVVRARLSDFDDYKQLAGPKFKTVRVVDKQGESTDVYFQLPIMKGLITLWYVTRFPPARLTGGGEVIEGTFVKGNIKGMHIAFTVRPGTKDDNSVLVCDLILRPIVPAPQSALDEELRDACGDAIKSLRKSLATER